MVAAEAAASTDGGVGSHHKHITDYDKFRKRGVWCLLSMIQLFTYKQDSSMIHFKFVDCLDKCTDCLFMYVHSVCSPFIFMNFTYSTSMLSPAGSVVVPTHYVYIHVTIHVTTSN